jgi:hypothetical protein
MGAIVVKLNYYFLTYINTYNMTIAKLNTSARKMAFNLALFAAILVALTLLQDFLRASLKNSAFYFSESFMFSSFWWLFAPIMLLQYVAITNKKAKHILLQAAIIVIPVFVHLLLFPLLVWALSVTFYYHTYAFQQTLTYTLSEHLYTLLFIYTIPALLFRFITKEARPLQPELEIQTDVVVKEFVAAIAVTDRNKKINLAVAAISHITASPPYINMYAEDKTYLHHETLKSIAVQLNPEQFVRIHKSTIVNINMAASYSTRLNGDYDLTLKNSVQLRISRNYAAGFKALFNKAHHLTTK